MKTSPTRPKPASLALAWLSYCADPDQESLLASELHALLRTLRLGWLPPEREEDARQDAYLLLVGKYLGGNPALLDATVRGDTAEMERQITRSAVAALKVCSYAFRRRIARDHVLESMDCDLIPASLHPAYRTRLADLPPALQRRVVFAALRLGVETGLISSAQAEIVFAMADRGLSQANVAKALGISRQAVHAKLSLIRQHLQGLIDKQEFPFS